MKPQLNCADVEILLADYVDQTLLDHDVAGLKDHFAICPACKQMAADAAAAVEFMERAEIAAPPPELVNRILFQIGNNSNHEILKPPLWQRAVGKVFGKSLQPILQPKFAMGMAMTMLSFGMLLRVEGVRQLSDLSPVNLYAAAEDRVTRIWDRGVKHYQSLKLVYEIQTRYQEWVSDQEKAEQEKANQEKSDREKADQEKKQ